MIGKGHSGTLVTIVERVTKFIVSKQVEGKTVSVVTEAIIELLKLIQDTILINGKGFDYHEETSEALYGEVYFAHPYSS